MVKRRDRQQSLFDETKEIMPLPAQAQTELVTQLALMMLALIDGFKTEVHDEQDRR